MTENIQRVQQVAAQTRVGDHLLIYVVNADTQPHIIWVKTTQLDRTGNITEGFEQRRISPQSRINDWLIPVTEGHIIAVTVTTQDTNPLPGFIFASISLLSGDKIDPSRQNELTHGYPTGDTALNYPSSQPRDSADLTPRAHKYLVPDPAAGSALVIDYTVFAQSQIIGGNFTFQTSATAGNRLIAADFTMQGDNISKSEANSTLPPSSYATFFMWRGSGRPTDSTNIKYLQLPDTGLVPQLSVTISSTNFAIGDTFVGSAIIANLVAGYTN